MSRLAPPNENIGTFISPALTGVFVSATISKPHVSPYHKPFICLLRHMVTSIPLVNTHSPLQESLTQRGTLNYDFSHNLIGEATQLTTYSELQVENQISTCSKAEERTDNKGEFKKIFIVSTHNYWSKCHKWFWTLFLWDMSFTCGEKRMRKVNSNQFQQAEKKISLRQKYYGTPCSLLFLGQTLETKGSIIKDLILYLFCTLGLNIAHYKCHLMDFWYHRSQRHSGQRPRRCKCFYEYRFACAVFWTMDFFIYIYFFNRLSYLRT